MTPGFWDRSRAGQWPMYETSLTDETQVMERVVDEPAPTRLIPRLPMITSVPASELDQTMAQVRVLERRVNQLQEWVNREVNRTDISLLAMSVSLVCTVFSACVLISVLLLGG